jgi:hypothetical protein
MSTLRSDHELPFVIETLGWEFHHIGIPTTNILPGEKYIPKFKMHVSGFDSSPFGIEWMRFEKDSPIDELIKTIPHVAFRVEDLDKELRENNFDILTYPNSPSDNIRVAMIRHNGAPVELIEFKIKSENLNS